MARPPFIAGFSYLGSYAYSLTCCTSAKAHHFASAPIVTAVLAQISRTAHERHFAVLAYCFMPDHLHLLVQGLLADSHLHAFVKLARQRSTLAFHGAGGKGRLWQAGYFERTIRSEEDLETVARYIVGNPVRAGLVGSLGEWPYSGGALVVELTCPP